MTSARKTRVLIVDDSPVVRRIFAQTLALDPEVDVVGTAGDAFEARDKILELHPDVLTLDIEMPRMDGLRFLRILQEQHPLPVVVISSLTQAGSQKVLDALEAGAVDVIAKPAAAARVRELREQLPHRVKGAARAQFQALPHPAGPPVGAASNLATVHPRQLIVIGASTGGTEALRSILPRLPAGLPPICIVQHIPALFSKAFADRLNDCCTFEVKEAADGDRLRPGLALVAPGDYHMTVCFTGAAYRVCLDQGPPLHHSRPSVDVLFESAAACAGPHAVSVLLTGMGSDGALGMHQLKTSGARTIVQDEASCVVSGMPQAAVALGAADQQVDLDSIPRAILSAVQDHAQTLANSPRRSRRALESAFYRRPFLPSQPSHDHQSPSNQ